MKNRILGLQDLNRILPLIASILLLSSCETEVELLAPYEETPVIYGVLDYQSDTQFVRINRTFLGPGDPEQYASIKDSVEYPLAEVNATIYKLNQTGTVLDSFPLQTIEIPLREEGIFYEENVLFYYTNAPLLEEDELNNPQNFTFQLRAVIRGELYTAETNFPGLSRSSIDYPPVPPQNPLQGLTRINLFIGLNNPTFSSADLRFTTDATTALYSMNFRMNFDFITNSGELVEDQFIDYSLGSYDNSELVSGREANATLSGEAYFNYLGNQLDLIPDLAEVQIENFQFRISGAAPEFSTYLDVAQPVSQFTPVLNSFTNISNGAIGVFTSATTVSNPAWVSELTMQQFNVEPLVAPYSFCNQGWTGSEYNCN